MTFPNSFFRMKIITSFGGEVTDFDRGPGHPVTRQQTFQGWSVHNKGLISFLFKSSFSNYPIMSESAKVTTPVPPYIHLPSCITSPLTFFP